MHAFLKTGTLGSSLKDKPEAGVSKEAKDKKKHVPWVEKQYDVFIYPIKLNYIGCKGTLMLHLEKVRNRGFSLGL